MQPKYKFILGFIFATIAGLFLVFIFTDMILNLGAKPNSVQSVREGDLDTPSDKKTCETLGGFWGIIGLISEERCNLPTNDAGKVCSDSDFCQGDCIAELSDEDMRRVTSGEEVTTKGKCTPWKITLGCQCFC